jgi:beta-lactamase superfamily II metal-dependent hydrolase
MERRDFLSGISLFAASSLFGTTYPAFAEDSNARKTGKSGFTLWQLPLLHHAQGNSYVFRTRNGKIIVMDGGKPQENEYLRGFIAALGNEVEAWFISHPHNDHTGALNEILKNANGIKINAIYHSEFSKEFYMNVEPQCRDTTIDFYGNLKKTGAKVIDITEPGLTVQIDGVQFKALSVKNEEITTNAYNNSSVVYRVWDSKRSVVVLGDAGVEEGDKILKSPFRNELNCDFLQMAHHGQQGVSKEFYQAVKFKACLWPTPLWLWNNDAGQGFNTGPWKTLETREWIKEMGITKHFVIADGLHVIE